MPRTGRRPGPNVTRPAILEAAQRAFAERGYEATSVRAIAGEVGVDPAVVLHFFGSKDGLFQAAVGWPFDPDLIAARAAAADPKDLGGNMARIFFELWDQPPTQGPLLAVLRSAMTHEASATLLREFLSHQVFPRAARLTGQDKSALGVNLASSHLIGIAVLRYALRVEPLASASIETMLTWITPALNHYLSTED
jgi:AcrR family transcriptional regulator